MKVYNANKGIDNMDGNRTYKAKAGDSSTTDCHQKVEFTTWLQFTNDHDIKVFKEVDKQCVCGPLNLLFVIVLMFTLGPGIIIYNFIELNPLYIISAILYCLALSLILIYITGRHSFTLTGEVLPRDIQDFMNFVIDGLFQEEMENLTVILFCVGVSLLLIAKVLSGISLSHTISPPIDIMLFAIISTSQLQLFFKNSLRKSTVIFSWLAPISTLCWAIAYHQSWSQVWILINSMCFVVLQYEFNRRQMLFFLKLKNAIETEKEKRKKFEREYTEKQEILSLLHDAKLREEKSKVELELIKMASMNEIKLKESESQQLFSVIGNVVHDLMTPIHSIKMDLELLKSCYDNTLKIYPDFIRQVVINEEMNPVVILNSLEASCTFIKMSTNRCMDYVKASSNIALEPTIESFDILSTFLDPIESMKHHLQPSDQSRIVIHPINENVLLHPYVSSDKHWFMENLLCLISNAAKFSASDTAIDITLDLVTESCLIPLPSSSTYNYNDECYKQLLINEENRYNYEIAKSSSKKGMSSRNMSVPDFASMMEQYSIETDDQLSPLKNTSTFFRRNISTACFSSLASSSTSSDKILSKKGTPLRNNYPSMILEESYDGSYDEDDNDDGISTLANRKTTNNNRQMIRVSVTDQGIGVPESERKKLFLPLKQTERTTGGVGLGLYSLSKRMEALNGYCGIESRSDGLSGSVFWFAFPYHPIDQCQSTSSSDKEPAVSSLYESMEVKTSAKTLIHLPTVIRSTISIPPLINTNYLKPLRILVVDDSKSILKITSRSLRARDHDVEVDEHGSQALERLKRAFLTQEFDVILTDLQMPVMDGFEFVRRYRAYENYEMLSETSDNVKISTLRRCNNRNGKLLIVGMSANGNDSSKQEALSSGMDTFMPKPFIYEDFVNSVSAFF